jgi:hypothetical protein
MHFKMSACCIAGCVSAFVLYKFAFKKRQIIDEPEPLPEIEDNYEFDFEEEDEPEPIENYFILKNPIYKAIVFENTEYEKYICDSKLLIENIKSWAYNRKVDEQHVNAIFKQLESMSMPHLIGSIKLVKDKLTNSLTLLDGQHRVMALTKFERSINIEVDVYISEDDIEIHELFMKANNNKNVTLEDIPEKKVIEIIDKMLEIWPKNIKTHESHRAYKPNITKREFYDALKEHITKTSSLHNKSTQSIVKNIININSQLSLKPFKELFGRDNPSNQKMGSYTRALKHDFFLNLDCKYNLQTWLKMLN